MEEKSELELRLDAMLEQTLLMQEINAGAVYWSATKETGFPVLEVKGQSGIGKTGITEQWAKENQINLCKIDFSFSLGCTADEQAEEVKIILKTRNFVDSLSKPKTVLFLEHCELVAPEVEKLLGKLIDEHIYVTPSGEENFLPALLFTIREVTVRPRRNQRSNF